MGWFTKKTKEDIIDNDERRIVEYKDGRFAVQHYWAFGEKWVDSNEKRFSTQESAQKVIDKYVIKRICT